MSETNNNRRYPSFMSVVEAVGKNGNFHFAVIRGLCTNFKTNVVNQSKEDERTIVNCSMPVNGRNKMINNALGTNYGDDDTIWLNVTFWNPAERLLKFLEKSGNPEKLQMVLTGAISLHKYTRENGGEGQNVRLQVNDFNIISAANTNNSSNTSTASEAPTEPKTPVGTSGAVDKDMDEEFVDISDVSEDDLPF